MILEKLDHRFWPHKQSLCFKKPGVDISIRALALFDLPTSAVLSGSVSRNTKRLTALLDFDTLENLD
jgi:hypothetical protein